MLSLTFEPGGCGEHELRSHESRRRTKKISAADDFARLTTQRALDTSERVLIPADER